jgi:hypothetical protein
VKQRAELYLDELGAVEPELAPERRGRGRDLERVTIGVAVRLRQRLHEGADLGLRVAGGELAAGMVGEGLPREHAELAEQLHLTGFEVTGLVPAADAHRPAIARLARYGRGRDRAPVRSRQPPPDQVRVYARPRDGDELVRLTRRASDDPCLAEAEHRARMLGKPLEHHVRVAQLLGRWDPCR